MMWCWTVASLWAVAGLALLSGCGNESENTTALLRAFDAHCIATRFDEQAFHTSIGLFDDDAVQIPGEDLYMLSPSNTTGYYLSDGQGDQLVAVMGLARSDDIESRSCGIISSVSFDDAKVLIANRFPLELVDQFDQGVSEFAVYAGSLVGYEGNIAVSVQGGYDLTTVSVYELPSP